MKSHVVPFLLEGIYEKIIKLFYDIDFEPFFFFFNPVAIIIWASDLIFVDTVKMFIQETF